MVRRKISGTSSTPDSVIYTVDYFNTIASQAWRGQVTPGQPNFQHTCSSGFRINEINLNPPGTPGRSPSSVNPAVPEANDGNFEYIEIINTQANQTGGTNFSGSLGGYELLMVDSGGAAAIGKVRKAWNLGRYATGVNGLLVLEMTTISAVRLSRRDSMRLRSSPTPGKSRHRPPQRRGR